MFIFYKICLILLSLSFISLLINLYINQPINDIILPTSNKIQSELSKIYNGQEYNLINNNQINNNPTGNEHKNNKYKIIIFPNELKLNKNKLKSIYEKELYNKIHKNDILITNDELNIKYPNNLKFENYKVEIIDSSNDNEINNKVKKKSRKLRKKDQDQTSDQPAPNPQNPNPEEENPQDSIISTNQLKEPQKPVFECSDKSREIEFKVSEYENRNVDLKKILYEFMASSNPYYEEIKALIPTLKQQLEENTFAENWFQLIGSSVWLEQYGVHLLTSRIFYTQTGNKVQPVISFVYVQAFDSNWNEIENLELIMPNGNTVTNYKDYIKDENKNGKLKYKTVKYPQFLPIPIYHNVQKQTGVFYGPEDPRLILIKNKLGYEEPVIIFNAYHRKFSKIKTNDNDEGSIYFDFHRSIFIGWLWETQIGKNNIEEFDETYTKHEYTKVKELILPNFKRTNKEKNWSPFIDLNERDKNGYDKSINLIYQFKNLKILKCYFHKEYCEWEYMMNEIKTINEFRGGTQLINLRTILEKINNPKSNKKGKELTLKSKKLNKLNYLLNSSSLNFQIWIGFARIALTNCGCGDKFYRPNMFVLVKIGEFYKISHISNSLDFKNIKIKQWDTKDENLCSGKNLIIPNGISSWEILDNGNSKEEQEDLLTLFFSRADVTVDFIYIKGLLNSLFKDKDDDYIFKLYSENFNYGNNQVIKNKGERTYNHEINQLTSKIFKFNDFTNFNVECSIKNAKQYCIDYSKQYIKTSETSPITNTNDENLK
ncbi:hypothetical protein KGF54_004877 [Candida jiufengensis]|uniref:uncharacterized protein n=1 Tax=Candida jiufengensis TaxID=497108 RepID=UPI002224C77D|nr:uncharacterized protein KGF54_004877 [Candida jiufengensis]KAI5951802.1 hypothetical protein KGF54_004877 [Candida jiufengensis]